MKYNIIAVLLVTIFLLAGIMSAQADYIETVRQFLTEGNCGLPDGWQ